jgi:hypothetical protein
MKVLCPLLFAGFGLLPLWLAIVLVVAGDSGSSDYWTAAPWVIFAAVPVCTVTLVIAAITSAVYRATNADHPRKLKRAAAIFGVLVVAGVSTVAFLLIRYDNKRLDRAAEGQAARSFVENHEAVRSATPAISRAMYFGTAVDPNGDDYRYVFSLYSPDTPYFAEAPDRGIYAIVDVDRGSGRAVFKLRCIVPKKDPRGWDFKDDPCPR